MTKLRRASWKKAGMNNWRNIHNSKKSVSIESYNKSYIVQNEKGFNAEGLIEIASSKVKARKSAVEYMEKYPYGRERK
jgi:hypothetical protein